jgi:membrane associated rhomboid family serine protease
MFGCALERLWGSWFFGKYFFVTGFGAGISTVCFSPASGIPTIGASGAVFGILLGYAFYFPNQIVYFNFLFPIKAKYLVLIYAALTFWFSFAGTGGGVAHIAHLGGMVFGFVYLNFYAVKHLLMKQIRKYKAARVRKRYRVIDGGKKVQRK